MVVHTGSSDQGAGSTDELGVVNTNELALVAGVAARGRNVASGGILDGTWTGTGLTSSSAASVDAAAGYEEAILAVAQNSQLVLGSYSNWAVGSASETLASNDILVKYTSNGDLTLDGAADDNAQTVINGLYDNGASSNNPYALGDLNGDGKIDDNDVTIFNGIYGNGMPPSGLLATATDASSVSLNWTAAPGALSYNIYRKDPGASSYVQVGSTSSTTYTDASFESDIASSYEVTAVGPLGETAPSNATTARTLSDSAGGYVTLWGYTQSPAQPNASDPSASGGIELGVQFSSDSSGYISGVQFFKGIQNTGTHTGELWDAEGHLLATASFTNESQSGWQQVDFSSPVMISAGTPYIVSYHTTSTHYAHDAGYFSSSGQNNYAAARGPR